jgi:choloylglycine hydrolase
MGACGLPGDYSSASRFVRAVFLKENTLREREPYAAVNRFFHLLGALSLTSGAAKTESGDSIRTIYSSCMDSESGCYFFTTYENSRIRAVSLRDADLTADVPSVFPLCDGADILRLPAK